MINPAKLLKLKGLWNSFGQRHPKFTKFLDVAASDYLLEGSVIDVTVKDPQGRELHTNLRVSKEDMEMYQDLRNAFGDKA